MSVIRFAAPAGRLLLAGALVLQAIAGAAAHTPAASAPRAAAPARPAATGRTWPLTRPEATGCTETSRYDDVVAFMKAMAAASKQIHLTTYGHTVEGRALPVSVIDRLEAHGITYFKTSADTAIRGERFRIASLTLEDREYQGTHRMRTLTGAWEAVEQTVPAGSLVVPMDQPLARLAFVLFDPRSDDGFMAWNILDPLLGAAPGPEFYPVLRTMEAVRK